MHRILLAVLLFATTASAQMPADSIIQLLRATYTPHMTVPWGPDTLVNGVRQREFRLPVAPDEWATALWTEGIGGSKPLVIFQHWGGGSKEYFRNEAVLLAKKGFSSVSLDAPWLWPTYDTAANPLKVYPDNIIKSCRAIISLLDWLEGEEDIDRQRIYYVGHSYGATLGGLMVAADRRIRAAVLMAGLGSVSASMREDKLGQWKKAKETTPGIFDTALRRLSVMEPEDVVLNRSAAIFYQAASRDQYVLPAQTDRYITAIKPSKIEFYDTDHVFGSEAALKDRIGWLVQEDKRIVGETATTRDRLLWSAQMMGIRDAADWRVQQWSGASTVTQPERTIQLQQEWQLVSPDTFFVITQEKGKESSTVRQMWITARQGVVKRNGQPFAMKPAEVAAERQLFYLYWAALASPLLKGSYYPSRVEADGFYVVESYRRPFQPVTLFIERSTGILRKIESTLPGIPVKKVTLWLEDYRTVDGAQRPFRYRLEQDGKPFFEAKLTQVLRNP